MTSTEVEEFDGVTGLFHQEQVDDKTPFAFDSHTLPSGELVTLRLIGKDPLWGHMLWNAGRITADYLTEHADELVKNRHVLELGAGAGLPSFVAAMKGAKSVVVTDYPYGDAVSNLEWNINHCGLLPEPRNIIAKVAVSRCQCALAYAFRAIYGALTLKNFSSSYRSKTE
jgi:predicted nicotinamide N-methyase